MNAFIRSVKSAAGNGGKEALIKKLITGQLSDSVKEIQLSNMGENLSGDSLQMGEAGTALCTVIEAMFLHGLKDSLVHRARMVMADIDVKPEPSFWSPLLIVSHKHIIDQITHLSQITSEIGQCRAWIRIALNDCILSSYLSTMRQDTSVLKPYYNNNAYMRDGELLEVAQKLIEGIETFIVFHLPCNSSLLNTWHQDSLVLAGIWSPTLRTTPVVSGVDIAQSLQHTPSINSETCSLVSTTSLNSHSSGFAAMSSLNEEEALKIILAKHKSESIYKPPVVVQKLTANDLSDLETGSSDLSINSAAANQEDCLEKASGWSLAEFQEKIRVEEQQLEAGVSVENSRSSESSYNALIESYNMLGGSYIRTPDLRTVWQRFDEDNNITIAEKTTKNEDCVVDTSDTLTVPLSSFLERIGVEVGLDAQNFECANCKESLALSPKPKVCGFTGQYFCDACMSTESVQLPARIVYNWDFKFYNLSKKAFDYIEDIKDKPIIDLKILNPCIYSVVQEMADLQALRIQLYFLREYLFTCRVESLISELRMQMQERQYLYEHVHKYSVLDLRQIQNSVLTQQLENAILFAKEHVQNCLLCSQKGFICEVCNKGKTLYPFDIDDVYRCNTCNAVFHKDCLSSNNPCPKCERKKRRQGILHTGTT